MKKETPKMIVGYCRCASTRDGDAKAVDEQRKKLERFAKERNIVIDRFYVDVGWSGNTIERPAFKRLMQACKDGKVGTLIVPDFVRIARDTTLMLLTIAQLKRLGVEVISIMPHDQESLSFNLLVLSAAEELHKRRNQL